MKHKAPPIPDDRTILNRLSIAVRDPDRAIRIYVARQTQTQIEIAQHEHITTTRVAQLERRVKAALKRYYKEQAK